MQIQYSLARELLVKHKTTWMLRIKMEFVHKNSRLLAAGSNQRMQFASQFLFVTRGRLNVGVDDDGQFCH